MKVPFDSYNVKHYNLTEYVGVIVRNYKGARMVAMPSQFFLRADGDLTIQSRTTDTGERIASWALPGTSLVGVLPNGGTVSLNI